jgi:hypothetical protein
MKISRVVVQVMVKGKVRRSLVTYIPCTRVVLNSYGALVYDDTHFVGSVYPEKGVTITFSTREVW